MTRAWKKPKRTKSKQSDLARNRFSALQLGMFITAFVVVGYIILRSFAASPLVASEEAEQLSLPATASVVSDPAASGGKAVLFKGSGTATGFVNFPAGVTSMSLIAKAEQCAGAPQVTISLDGKSLAAPLKIDQSKWSSFKADLADSVAAGSHSLSVSFSNHTPGTAVANSRVFNGCSPALYIDVIDFYGPEPATTTLPAVSLSATPTTVNPGTTTNLTWSSTNATSCTASGAWSGGQQTAGTVASSPLAKTSTFSLACTGAGGSANASVTVTVKTVSYGSPPYQQEFGYDTNILNQSDGPAYAGLASAGAAASVRDTFVWSTIEDTKNNFDWSKPDKLVTLAAQAGLDVDAVAVGSPSWAANCAAGNQCGPSNPADYANFVGQLAARYGHGGSFWSANPDLTPHPLAAIEIWSQENLSSSWNNPSPADYTALLKASYTSIKAADPQMFVLSGGLAAYGSYGQADSSQINPVSFLADMYKAGASGAMDGVGWQAYNYANTSDVYSMIADSDSSSWSQMNETSPSARSLMTQYGDSDKKIWLTGTGAPTSQISNGQQANLALQEMNLWKSYGWAGNFYWYDLRDDCSTASNANCTFGAVKTDNTVKPVYAILKAAWTNEAQEQ